MTTGDSPHPSTRLIHGDDAQGQWIESALRADWQSAADEGVATSLVYLAASRAGGSGVVPDLDDARATFDCCRDASLDHVVLVSSAAVHEPSHHHPSYIGETQLAPRWTGNRLPDCWLDLERLATELAKEVGARLTILRPAPVVTPGGRDFWSRLFQRRVALTLPGFDPTLQLLSVDDLARALDAVLRRRTTVGDAHEIYHVAPDDSAPLHASLRHCGVLRLPVPGVVQALPRKLLAGLGAAQSDQLDALRHASTVSDGKIREHLGFEPAKSSLRAAFEARGARELAVETGVESEATSIEPHDPWGLDRAYVRRLSATLFRFLHDLWWRIEVKDLHHLPRQGPAVLVGVHRGFQPWDGVMAMHHISRETGRFVRFLVHPTLVKFPFLAPYMIKMGGVHASRENADRILASDQVLAVFPEGIRGAFRRYGPDVYRLGKFGRHEYIRFALAHGAPIVPFVTVGPAEIYPIFGKLNWSWWKRFTEWPCFPITPTMGTVPLPSKWHTLYLEPLHFDYPPEAADDPELVRRLGRQVKARMAAALDDLVRRRRRVFWGRIWPDDEA